MTMTIGVIRRMDWHVHVVGIFLRMCGNNSWRTDIEAANAAERARNWRTEEGKAREKRKAERPAPEQAAAPQPLKTKKRVRGWGMYN